MLCVAMLDPSPIWANPFDALAKKITDLGGKKGRWHVTKTIDHELFTLKVLVHEPIEWNPWAAS